MKSAVLIFAALVQIVCVSSARADDFLDCVSRAYNEWQTKQLEAWRDIENTMREESPAFIQKFEPQLEKMRTEVKLNSISLNYFVESDPGRVKESLFEAKLPLMSLAPNWTVEVDGKRSGVYIELMKLDEFSESYQYYESLEARINAVKNDDVFKSAAEMFYRLLSEMIKTGQLDEEYPLRTVDELGCGDAIK